MSNIASLPDSPAVTVSPAPSQRLMSIDALRGFDMFWIVGGDALVKELGALGAAAPLRLVAGQMDHKAWAGFAFYDLIFPMFVFIVGVSLVFSLTRLLERDGHTAAVWRVVRRGVLLYLLGIFCYGGFDGTFEHIRLLGVLQRIGLAYLFAGLAFCFLKPRSLIVLAVTLLVGYWAAMSFIPVPGGGVGDFAEGRNLANWIDAHYLPFRKWDGDHDPEGLLGTFPAVANCLLGVLAGLLLRRKDLPDLRQGLLLLGLGASWVVLGWLWHLQFPVIKKLWTSSFVLVACGYSCLLLGTFYLVIDVWNCRRWAQPFVWIGMNAITVYLLFDGGLMNFNALAKRFVGGELGQLIFGRAAELAVAVTVVVMVFGLCRWLYTRKIFLRL